VNLDTTRPRCALPVQIHNAAPAQPNALEALMERLRALPHPTESARPAQYALEATMLARSALAF